MILRIALLVGHAVCTLKTAEDNGLGNASLVALLNLDPVTRSLATLEHNNQIGNFAVDVAVDISRKVAPEYDTLYIPNFELLTPQAAAETRGIVTVDSLIDLLDEHIVRLGESSSIRNSFFTWSRSQDLNNPSHSHKIILVGGEAGHNFAEFITDGSLTWKLTATIDAPESTVFVAHVLKSDGWHSYSRNETSLSQSSPDFVNVLEAFYVLEERDTETGYITEESLSDDDDDATTPVPSPTTSEAEAHVASHIKSHRGFRGVITTKFPNKPQHRRRVLSTTELPQQRAERPTTKPTTSPKTGAT